VRTPENIHIIVPNASFLEQDVINWTLSDHSIRSTLRVGVAYGSPVRDVEHLLYSAVREHPKVLDEPEPNVLFADFGDSALIFEAEFWTTIRTQLDRRRLLSDLRFRIDELFRENGITIAFPQRDVHLDTTRPLHVRVSTDRDRSA
jgi:small-conductance mechanosensitive channel